MTEPLTHGDFHVFFRGISRALGSIPYKTMYVDIAKIVWGMGVGETDHDPLFLFDRYDLLATYCPVESRRSAYGETEVVEVRSFDVADGLDGRTIDTVTFQRMRQLEEGEVV